MITIYQLFLLVRDWSKRSTWPNMPQLLKTGEYPRIFPRWYSPIFKPYPVNSKTFVKYFFHTRCKKYLKDNKHNSLHLPRKHAGILVLRHHRVLEAHSFPRASLLENCLHLGTDTVGGQTSVYISRQMEAIIYSSNKNLRAENLTGRSF